MIRSMTGYSRAEGTRNGCTLGVELKSVNHRYCEVVVQLPKPLSNVEEAVKKQIRRRVTRGHIEFSAKLSTIGSRKFQFDLNAAEAYYQALKTLKDKFHLAGEMDVSHFAFFSGDHDDNRTHSGHKIDCPTSDENSKFGPEGFRQDETGGRSGVSDRPYRKAQWSLFESQ